MEVSAFSRRARHNAGILVDRLDLKYPNLRSQIRQVGAVEAVGTVMGIDVDVTETVADGCTVAGSSDPGRRSLTIVRASPARMAFTVLHEVGHIEGYDDNDFQQALADSPKNARRDVEEDACEAFAASFVLPSDHVDAILDSYRLTASGVVALHEQLPEASWEACAVAAAHRLNSPGYVVLVNADGTLQFAARSGDAFPIRRGSRQSGSDLNPLLSNLPALRAPGHLLFPGGSKTDRMYIDAVRVGDRVVAVAVTDSPDWPVLHQPDTTTFHDKVLHGWCPDCSQPFTATSRCLECGFPRHEDCGRCECMSTPVSGERQCAVCNYVLPGHLFTDPSSNVCQDCE